MKRAGGSSFCVLLLLFLQVEAYGTGPVRTNNNERTYYNTQHDTRTVPRDSYHNTNGQNPRTNADFSHVHDPRLGELRTTTDHTTTNTRMDERSYYNPSNNLYRNSGIATRTVGDIRAEKRTYGWPTFPPGRSDSTGEEHVHTRHGDTITVDDKHNDITTSDSRTDNSYSNNEELRHSSTFSGGRAEHPEHPAPKNAHSRTHSEEGAQEELRTGEQEEKSSILPKEAHPIGLINALDGRSHGRSVDLDAIQQRQMDAATTIIAAGIIGFAVMLFILFCIAEVSKKRREKKADSTRLLRVFQYLHEFNVDDIDIQLSAAGGFHVGYLNGLAQGINTKKQPDQKTDTSSDEGEGSGSLSKKV